MAIKMSPELINTMIGIQVGDADQGKIDRCSALY